MSTLRLNHPSLLLHLLLFCCSMSALWKATVCTEELKITQSPSSDQGPITLRLQESTFLSLEVCFLDSSYMLEVEVGFDGGRLQGGQHLRGTQSLSYNDAETNGGCVATVWESGDQCKDLVTRVVNSPLYAHREARVDLVLRQRRDNVVHLITRRSFEIRMLKGDEEEMTTTSSTTTTEIAEPATTTATAAKAETTVAGDGATGAIEAAATSETLSPAISGDSMMTLYIVAGAGGVLLLVIIGIVVTIVVRRCKRRRTAFLDEGKVSSSSTSLDKPRELSPASRALNHVSTVTTDLAE